MSLELRQTSKRFYSRIVINGKRRVIALKTEYQGKPPPNMRLREQGDAAFERSRGKALEEEARLREKLQRSDSEVKLRKRVYEVLTGQEFKVVKIDDLFDISSKHTRERPWSERYQAQVRSKADALLQYLKEHHPEIEHAHQLNRQIAESFLNNHQAQTNCSAKTFNDVKAMLQGLWTVAEELGLLEGNPFRGIARRAYISATKEIFTPEQVEDILKESEKDPELHTVIVVALSTGMRMVDCCHLEWSSIDLKERMVEVPAQKKNMQPANIPFFGHLEELILAAKAENADSKYVFPRVRYLYERDKQYFTRSFSALLLRIGFTDDENRETSIRVTLEGGCRRRPLRSFHGLRTTWMTMALNGGISLEDVQKICGSIDTETVLKHYFRSNGARLRAKLRATMPVGLGGLGIEDTKAATSTENLLQLIEQMDGENWQFIQQRLLDEIERIRKAS
jgi:integrase